MLFRSRGERVGVFAGAHDDGIEILGTIKDLPEIRVLARLRKFRRGLVQVLSVDVAKGDDVFGRHGLKIAATAPARADDGEVEFVVQVLPTQEGWGHADCSGGGEHRAGELSAVEKAGFHIWIQLRLMGKRAVSAGFAQAAML